MTLTEDDRLWRDQNFPNMSDEDLEKIIQTFSNGIRNRNQQQQDKPMSILGAKRIHSGKITVIGTIVSVSEIYVLESINDDTNASPEYRDAKLIQLEDTETLDENERLDVILYDDMVTNVIAGEMVQVTGSVSVERKGNYRSRRKINVLHATSIKYLNKKEVLVTKKDIEGFHKFVSLDNNPIDRLVDMFAPNIIGHEEKKRGLLRSIVGGINRGINGDGRISTLMVGDPGTAKSQLGKEASKIKPRSRHVSAPHATTKTITAIVEKVNESISLMLGAIPLSKGALCAIDEITSFPMEDQSRLLDVLDNEGIINLDKLGRRYVVPATTTIIATANPIGGTWNSDQIATKEEIELKTSLMDRFTQLYTSRDDMNEKQCQTFVEEMSQIRKRREHNYNFLRKYLIHASSIKDVKFTKKAEEKLNEFWSDGKVQGLLSIRMYEGIYKMVEAHTKLQLRNIVDEEIAEQVLQDIRLMMVQYGETVRQLLGPRELTVKTCQDILRNTETGMTIEAMCEQAVNANDQIASYLGYIWRIDENIKLRRVVDSLLNHRNIKKIQSKPMVLKWLTDQYDLYDPKNGKLHMCKNVETGSDRSDRSDRND